MHSYTLNIKYDKYAVHVSRSIKTSMKVVNFEFKIMIICGTKKEWNWSFICISLS